MVDFLAPPGLQDCDLSSLQVLRGGGAAESFVTLDGKRFLRMVERLKRMIAAPDTHRGETVKALVVLRPDFRGQVEPSALIAWCREHMAAYKCPRALQEPEIQAARTVDPD